MFRKKYIISLLNEKWVPIDIKIKLTHIPRIDEYLYINEHYYQVLNVIHQIKTKQEIFIIIKEAFIGPDKK